MLGYDRWTKNLRIAVRAQAEGGKANNAVIHVLAELLNVAKVILKLLLDRGLEPKKS